MALRKLLIFPLFFCSALLVKSDAVSQESGKDEEYFPLISSVLDYLNSNPNRVYDYKRGSLLSAQNKGDDVVEITVEVEVNCNNRYPDIPCNEQHTLICDSFVGRNPAQPDTYHVLSDVRCSPKIEITMEDMDVSKSVAPMAFGEQNLSGGKIELSNEALSPEHENPDFFAVQRDTVPCLGCNFDLHSDAEGVDELIDTAVKHIESERNNRHKITNVRRLQQQVVAGLKYILLADVAQTTCSKDADVSAPCILDKSVDPFICEVTFIQKPWISISKHVIKNNCTISQEFEPAGHSRQDRNDISNEIIPHKDLDNPTPDVNPKPNVPNYDAMAQSGNIEESMDADRLADLESQILFGDMFEAPTKIESPQNLAPPHFIQEEYDTGDEPSSVPTDIDSLRIEPLNSGRPSELSTLYVSMPVISEEEPVVMMYTPQNEDYVNTPSDNFLPNIKSTSGSFLFGRDLSPYERLVRELNGDSDSDSDSDSSEEKKGGKKVLTKRKVSNTSEDSSSGDTEESKKVKKDTSESKGKSDSNSSPDSSSEEKKRQSGNKGRGIETTTIENGKGTEITTIENGKGTEITTIENVDLVKREVANTSEEDSVSKDTSEDHKRTKRDTSEEDSGSKDTSEEKKRVKRDTSEEDSDSKNTSEDNKRVKRDTNKDSSSSSSSSSESKDKTEERAAKLKAKSNGLDSSSSSSSSSESKDKTEKNNSDKENLKKKSDDTSESSSSSDDSSEEKRNRDKRRTSEDFNEVRRARSVGQLEKISPDEKVIVRDLADFAAATLDNIDDDHHKRVILQILGAKKLKLDGIYYQIILRLGISHCHEYEHHENCREKLFTNLTKICKVQVHVEDDYSNPKVVKSQCQNIKKDENDRNRTNYSRYRRAVLVGGHVPMSTNDPSVKKFLSATLEHLDSVSDHPNKHKTINVVSATSQVVAGARYIVTAKIGLSTCKKFEDKLPETCELLENSEPETCTIDVWDRPWLNKTIYTITCNEKIYTFGDDNHSRTKRQLVGGESPLPESEIQNYVQKALLHLDTVSNESNKFIAEKVLHATTQVVAGSLVRIRVRITVSDCPKGSDSTNCAKLEGSQSTNCNFKIWEKPWLNFTETTVKCQDKPKLTFKSKREIGGWNRPQLIDVDEYNHPPSNQKASTIVSQALVYLSSKTESGIFYKLFNLTDVFRHSTQERQFWVIEAEILRCMPWRAQNRDICDDHFSCQFRALESSELVDSLKINITCANDDEVYIFEPIKRLHDNYQALETAFRQFATKYNKVYNDELEFQFRLKVFRDNLNKIALLNKYELGTARYGVTRYADLTEQEFSQRHGYRPDLRKETELPFAQASIPRIELPTGFDWRTKGAVSEVKNQGFCGSCWAFSVTGNVEGQYAIKHGNLLEFSEQELVDCDKTDSGCDGGLMDNAYRSIEKLGGLEEESDYPYEGDDETCHFNVSKVRVQLTGALNISHNETDMAKWLVQNGPISIAINANAMQFYFGGVSHPWKSLCNPNSLDHGVLIVGYGVDKFSLLNKTIPYWIVKNSWGTSWGEQGYYRVYRGDGTCGLNQTPSSAIVA